MDFKQLTATGLAWVVCNCALAQTSVGPPPANVPSSVNMYGVLDVSAYDKQQAGETRLRSEASGAMTTSRWGITGNEDLGDGVRAIFDLSSFIRLDTGESGKSPTDSFFGRTSYVGLSSKTLGAIRLGRITTPTFLSEVNFGAFLDSTTLGPYLLHTFIPSAVQPMITGNGLLDSAWSNSISYTLPAFDSLPGFTASVQAAASEGTGGRRIGGAATYRGQVFGATFTFDRVDHATLGVGAPSPAIATVARPTYNATEVRTYQGGAYYDFKVARVWAQANQTTFTNTTASQIRLRTFALSGTVPLGLLSVIGEWARTNEARTNVVGQKRDTVSAGVDYFLSKRTDTYAVLMHDAVTNLSSGTGFALGLRHRF